MRDDDFDQRGRRAKAGPDVTGDPARAPGRQSVGKSESSAALDGPTAPGKRTRAQPFDMWTRGTAGTRAPVVEETEANVRKAREVIAKLAAQPPLAEARLLRAELQRHIDAARSAEPQAPSVLQVSAEAQPHLAADAAGEDTIAIARRGIAGPGQALPHAAEVQRLFGSHDISGIVAHVGGAAGDASRELGAQAYAHGNHVAFTEEPKLGLVAHEAAHVVQSRGGVSFKKDEPGDSFEQHADDVAALVVRGQSAEQLLGQKSGGAPAVQRAPLAKSSAESDYDLFKAEKAGADITAPAFVHLHTADLRRDIDLYLLSRNLTTGVAEVTFTPDIGPFMDALFASFDASDNAGRVSMLRNWVAPADLYEIVDRNRPIFEADKDKTAWNGNPNDGLRYGRGRKGPPQYTSAVGTGIGAAIEERLLDSLKRMAQQLVAATARHRDGGGKDTPVAASELVPSHPLDWQVALAMVGRGTPTVQVAAGAHAGAGTRVAYHKVKKVEWQGALGGPWNAVRVDPPDAGPEAVAAELLGASTEAYRIQRVGRYFLLPEDQAMRFPEAAWARRGAQGGDAVAAMAHGKNASYIERTEAERGLPADAKAPTPSELKAQWDAINEQLRGIAVVVRPYGLDADIGLALSRHAVHAVDLPTITGHDAAVRGQLFAKQASLLDRVASQVSALTANAPTPKPGASSKTLHDVLAKLVRVANLSHLPETGESAMAEVVAAQRAMVPDALEAALGDIATQIEIARQVGGQARQAQHRSQGTYGASLAERADGLRQRVATFRSNMLRDKADASELETLTRDLDALRFEAGIVAEVGQLGQLFEVLDELEDSNWVLLSEGLTSKIGDTNDDNRIGRLETARRGSMDLRRELNLIHGEWLDVEKTAQAVETGLAKGGVKDADSKARAIVQPRIAMIQAKLKKLGGEEAVQAFLKDAYNKIDSAETRAKIVQIATLIGVAALASATGGLAGGIAEGLGASAGSLGVSMVSLTAETAMFTAVSARLSGEPVVAAFINNGIGNLLTFGAMKGVGKMLEGSETVGWTLKMAKAGAKVRTAALLGAKTLELTSQALVAQGIQIAQAEYESMRETGHAMSTQALEMTAAQGMAMMIGTALSHRVFGDPSLNAHAIGNELGTRITRLRAMSDAVAGGGDPGQAVALMQQTRALVEDIGNRAKELSTKNDQELGSLGYTRHEVEALAKFAGTQSKSLASMDAGSFAAQLGLHSVVPGRVFSGDTKEVQSVLRDFASRGYAVESTGDGFRVSKKDEPPIDLFVRAEDTKASEQPRSTTNAKAPRASSETAVAGADKETASSSAHEGQSASHRDVLKDHPSVASLDSLPAEAMVGAQQQARVRHLLEGLPKEDYATFTKLANELHDPVARGFLYKALAAGNTMTDLTWFAAEIAGKDRGWLIDHLTLGDPRGVGGGVKQQWSTSCNAAVTLTLRGNYDPVFALRLRNRNAEVGEVDDHDPHALNMNQADLEKQMLESPYAGNHPASPKPHQGVAAPRVSQGTGRYADDLLNSQAKATGITFASVANPNGTQVVAVLERSLAAGMQVPLVVGDMSAPQAHYVLVQSRREVAGDIEYNVHDPWTGESTWIKASDIANDSIPGAYHKVGTVEVPNQVAGNMQAPQHGATPKHSQTPHEQQPKGAHESTPGAASKTTDLATFVEGASKVADSMAKAVDPAKATAVRDVEIRALASDAQVEAGLRVMDPVFGKQASNAFKEASKTADAGTMEAVEAARDRAMQAMLTILRDPRADISTRRRALVSELTRYENDLGRHPKLDLSRIDFAEAKAQALGMSEKPFASLLTVDDTGALSQAGKPAGTLHALIETVKSANAAYRERKIAREFVLSITSPSDPKVPREVKILSRVPKETTGAAPSKIIEPLQNVDGTVVDIGVGLGSFARDAAQEKGPLVQTEFGPKYADAAMTRRDLTWEHTGPRTDVDSVLVLGDSLQTLSMMFAPRSVKRLFINNINAHYEDGSPEYRQLATGLRQVMAVGGRVEVQWTDDLETTGTRTSSRGHITGMALEKALELAAATSPRAVTVSEATPVTDFNYSIEAPRPKTGVPSKAKPTDPVPRFRTVFTFGE